MNVITIASIIIMLTLLFGAALAVLFTRFSVVVTETQASLEKGKQAFDPNLTAGHPITVNTNVEEQLREARRLAARRAAHLPRGANMRIGRLGAENLRTAKQGVNEDPVTAVKIAAVHGWQILHMDAPWLQPATPVAAAGPATAAPTRSAEDLVPGKDYPFIEITDEMSPEEVRKARIANARAKSAAIKALKEAGVPAATPEAVPAGNGAAQAPARPEVQTQPAPAAAGGAVEPVPGRDYEEIPITDDMSPDEIRKARIANARARAAAAKAMKAAGVTAPAAAPAAAPSAEPEPQPEPQPVQDQATPAVDIPADIPRPEYVEITDDMSPDEVRRARINNARAKAAYQKALKAAGIDPATVRA